MQWITRYGKVFFDYVATLRIYVANYRFVREPIRWPGSGITSIAGSTFPCCKMGPLWLLLVSRPISKIS